ncbi:MAG: phage portal protein, partial [Pseudomonadota bacterium]
MKSFLNRIKSFVLRPMTLQSPDGWYATGAQSDSGEWVTAKTALSLSAVWGCINLIAGTSASLPLMVYRSNASGDREVDAQHPLYRLLHDSPNFEQTAMDFWEFMFASLELRGNAFAEKIFNGTRLVALEPIASDMISVKRNPSGTIEYNWTVDGRSKTGSEQTVFHIRGFGGNPLGGLSTLEFARNAFGLARSTEVAASKTFSNGLRPSGVLTFSEFLSKEKRAIARKHLTSQFVGAEN